MSGANDLRGGGDPRATICIIKEFSGNGADATALSFHQAHSGENWQMNKLLLGIAALACVGIATPAMAERVIIKEGPGYHHHRHFRHYNRMDCWRVTIRERRPNGTLIVKHIRRCH